VNHSEVLPVHEGKCIDSIVGSCRFVTEFGIGFALRFLVCGLTWRWEWYDDVLAFCWCSHENNNKDI